VYFRNVSFPILHTFWILMNIYFRGTKYKITHYKHIGRGTETTFVQFRKYSQLWKYFKYLMPFFTLFSICHT
jgi:hypothetical protein